MGSGASKPTAEQQQKHKAIEKQIANDRLKAAREVKLLLLGAGESGKSTILKQMRILHDNGFSAVEMMHSKSIIYNNTLMAMSTILQAMYTLEIPLDTATHEADAALVLQMWRRRRFAETAAFDEELRFALGSLWRDDGGVRRCFQRRNEFQLDDSAQYFLDAVDRVAQADYMPTQEDVLHSRAATAGVVEVDLVMKNMKFRVFDVGGQRSQRRKWIHFFDDVGAIIFVTSLSEFDQTLREDHAANRMVESLNLFGQICNSEWFISTSMIIFLNKTDLFKAKLKQSNITVVFPSYTGGQDYDEASLYIEKRFAGRNENGKRPLYFHRTCAIDSNQVELVLASVIDTIIRLNRQQSGMS